MSSSLLSFLQCFGRYVLRPSPGVCQTWEPSQNFELHHFIESTGVAYSDSISHNRVQLLSIPWGLPEVVGTVQQVHCSRRRLFRRDLEFHVCTINKSAYTKKVLKLMVCTIYIYIYICKISIYNKAIQGQVFLQSFNSLRQVALPRLENLIYPTIYPLLEGE